MTPLDWIERYELRSTRETHEGWAILHIDSKGFLGIVSDFGNYAYHWSSFGDDFKAFLSKLDWAYLYRKLTHVQGIYDGETTARGIRDHILEYRRTKGLSREMAREEWELLRHWREVESSEFGFHEWYNETKLDQAAEFYCTMPEPQCRMFCQKVWPRFIEALAVGRPVPLAFPKGSLNDERVSVDAKD